MACSSSRGGPISRSSGSPSPWRPTPKPLCAWRSRLSWPCAKCSLPKILNRLRPAGTTSCAPSLRHAASAPCTACRCATKTNSSAIFVWPRETGPQASLWPSVCAVWKMSWRFPSRILLFANVCSGTMTACTACSTPSPRPSTSPICIPMRSFLPTNASRTSSRSAKPARISATSACRAMPTPVISAPMMYCPMTGPPIAGRTRIPLPTGSIRSSTARCAGRTSALSAFPSRWTSRTPSVPRKKSARPSWPRKPRANSWPR